MATVTLPLNFVVSSGTLTDTVVYQGTLARVYTVPSDPRTTLQLDTRHQFYDFVKMRSSMGSFGKGVLKTVLGTKWATILLQLVQTNADAHWSTGIASWNLIAPSERAWWNANAPYQATWNQPGIIWRACWYVIYYALFDNSNFDWGIGTPNFGHSPIDVWWAKTTADIVQPGFYNDDFSGFTRFSVWTTVSPEANAYAGQWQYGYNNSFPYFEAYFLGTYAILGFVFASNLNTAQLITDGNIVQQFNQYANPKLFNGLISTGHLKSGVHNIRLKFVSGNFGVDFVRIRKSSNSKIPWLGTTDGRFLATTSGYRIVRSKATIGV